MRPLRLEVRGFTSFRDVQTVDFAELDLFALWGPTGSGKSSLLDAMTYALYGQVERVGKEASQLVSQGQPRMAVKLDFRVDGSAYRVTRSTSSGGGGTKVLLERQAHGSWESYGDGADKVREVDKALIALIGLDYDAFTRSVLLPQGKFAEFLVGEADERRRILTDLLGLELFGRMGKRARAVKEEARLQQQNKRELVDREYGSIDEESVAAVRGAAATLARRAVAARELERSIEELAARWTRLCSRRAAIAGVLAEVTGCTEDLRKRATALERLDRQAGDFERSLKSARAAEAAALGAAEDAQAARLAAEERWGKVDEIAALAVLAGSFLRTRKDLAAAAVSLDEARAALDAATAGAARATEQVEAARRTRQEAEDRLAVARAEHDRVHRKDLVGGLTHGLGKGEPCPVCERPLERVPKAASAGEIEAAAKAATAAEKAKVKAEQELAAAERELARAEATKASAAQSIPRCEKAWKELKTRCEAMHEELAGAFDDDVPEDPERELQQRLHALKDLKEKEERAVDEQREAGAGVASAEKEQASIAASVGEHRAALVGTNLAGIVARVRDAAPEVKAPDPFGKSLPAEAAQLARLAQEAVESFDALDLELGAELERVTEAAAALAEEARAALPSDLDIDAGEPPEMIDGVRRAAGELATEAALADEAARVAADRLEARKRLEDEIAAHHEEQVVYDALQKDLRSDRIVQFLQAEALGVLAAAATEHLRELSGTRYRLVYDGDRFFVIDAWNGDERRNVKTLSGGETFLTSLALALALSEQIQLLSVTEKGRLESLFLDEGFGSLDVESLEVVVDAIERLRGEDRLVGVITHVNELADRLPVRLEITKSPRGSQVARSA